MIRSGSASILYLLTLRQLSANLPTTLPPSRLTQDGETVQDYVSIQCTVSLTSLSAFTKLGLQACKRAQKPKGGRVISSPWTLDPTSGEGEESRSEFSLTTNQDSHDSRTQARSSLADVPTIIVTNHKLKLKPGPGRAFDSPLARSRDKARSPITVWVSYGCEVAQISDRHHHQSSFIDTASVLPGEGSWPSPRLISTARTDRSFQCHHHQVQ